MSIEKTTVQHRKLVVKAGMTAEDVQKSKDATALQKKYANVFDSDGQKGFSQKEADLFNATTFSEKADGSVMFWTRQKDGTKKGVKFSGNIDEMNYSVKSEVKPYVTTKKVAKKTVKQPKQEEVSFWDSKWSGHQIAKLTGDNAFTDWLQDKDKVCTDGKDDGKIGFWEGTKSLAKGLIGGIPKAVINHPVATAVTVGLGAAATVLTGGAILPILGAAGVVSGVGMAGYGTYKAATAKTDGEAKQALETLGMGVTTTVLSSASAGKALESAQSAGVKSAKVAEDASILTKTTQMFKATPEALKVSGHNSKISVTNIYTMPKYNERTLFDGTKEVYESTFGPIKQRTLPDGTQEIFETKNSIDRYNTAYRTITRTLPDGTKEYYTPATDKSYITHPDGAEETYFMESAKIARRRIKHGYKEYYNPKYESVKTQPDGTKALYSMRSDKITYRQLSDGTREWYEPNNLKHFSGRELPDGTREYYNNGYIKERYKGDVKEFFTDDGVLRTRHDRNADYVYNRKGQLVEEYLPDFRVKYYEPDGSLRCEKNIKIERIKIMKDFIHEAIENDAPQDVINDLKWSLRTIEDARTGWDVQLVELPSRRGHNYAEFYKEPISPEPHYNLLGIDQDYYDEQIRLHGKCTVSMW